VNDPKFGKFWSGAANRNFILNTNGTISGSSASDYISGATAGTFTIKDSTPPLQINIQAINITNRHGATINQVLCSYNSGAQTRCDNGGYTVTSIASAPLKIGLNITTTTSHAGGFSASPYFDLEITYY
jgi:hypothetical protein